jgi:hypothetical protein
MYLITDTGWATSLGRGKEENTILPIPDKVLNSFGNLCHISFLSTIGKLSEKMILRRITPPKKNVTEFKSV